MIYESATALSFRKLCIGLALLACCGFLVTQEADHHYLLPFYGDLEEPEYRTPLAGKEAKIILAGEEIVIPARDRRKVLAFNIGSSIFSPAIGDTTFAPFAALYSRNHWQEDHRRLRAVVSGVANYIEFYDGTWNDDGWELILQWQNFTVPLPSAEIINDKVIDESEIYWGHFLGSLGGGWRLPVYPYHCDNSLRLSLFYEPGYLYIRRSSKTGEQVILPPSTVVHQMHAQLRFDCFDRNLLELPHRGWAAGVDVTIGRREHWSDHRFTEAIVFEREKTRDYLRATSYFVGAFGLPFLSEHHRFLLFCHAGWSPSGNWDRFSAFRIGGGPLPSESNDLSRNPFPGALFDQFIAETYMLINVEYRLEILFFLYAHVRGTLAWGRVAYLDERERLAVSTIHGRSFSVGLSSGFLWNSSLYVEYAYDNHVIRRTDSGHSILISWSKEL